MQLQRVELAPLVEQLVAAYAPLARPGVAVTGAVPAGTAVLADPGRLRQALCHLLDNACQFTLSGTIQVAAVLAEAGACVQQEEEEEQEEEAREARQRPSGRLNGAGALGAEEDHGGAAPGGEVVVSVMDSGVGVGWTTCSAGATSAGWLAAQPRQRR
jgi:signal transduction histidine kinase